jgi:hypothetical protein
MQSYLFALEEYEDPYYLAYLTLAYQRHYNHPDLLTDFFLDPYAAAVPGLFDGMQSAGAINAQLTTQINDLVQPGIINNISTDPAYEYLVDTFQENSLTDWAPEAALHLYHGESDTTVPFENSSDMYAALMAHGASSDVVSMTALEGTHTTALTPYIQDFVPKLWSLR